MVPTLLVDEAQVCLPIEGRHEHHVRMTQDTNHDGPTRLEALAGRAENVPFGESSALRNVRAEGATLLAQLLPNHPQYSSTVAEVEIPSSFTGGPFTDTDWWQDACNAIGRELRTAAGQLRIRPDPQGATAPLNGEAALLVILEGFDRAARQLRSRHKQRDTLTITDEYDVQDLLHALLVVCFDDVRDEEWTPSYGGGSSRVDFLLKSEKIVIEAKMTREGLASRQARDQLAIDVQNYRSHSDCRMLVCFVYDPAGRINNPRGFETDLSRDDGPFPVRVLVRPK